MKPEGRAGMIQAPAPGSVGAIAADRNVMPSMVVRQQRIHQMSANQNLASVMRQQGSNAAAQSRDLNNLQYHHPDPHLQHQDTSARLHNATGAPTASLIKAAKELGCSGGSLMSKQLEPCLFDQDGLVLPKRVLHHNPIGIEAQPIIRDLNRELKFNQIRGKNVLDQKSELKKALEKLEENKRRKEAEQERLNRRTSLELRLEERAERLKAKETASPASKVSFTQSTSTHETNKSSGGSSTSPATTSATCMNSNATPLSNFSIKPITR